jgi:hypothetical protein
MVKEKTQLGAIGAGLADLNEMRLSKFEYALFTAKLMEVSEILRRHAKMAVWSVFTSVPGLSLFLLQNLCLK